MNSVCMGKVIACLLIVFCLVACRQKGDSVVRFDTSQGTIRVKLYDDTPLHRANFLKLVKDGYYDGMLFHRVIREFMVQAGDPDSRNARPEIRLGAKDIGYTLDAEILPLHYHKRGALVAARETDRVNPERKSSGSHFYIVQGRVFSGQELDTVVQIINNQRYTALFERLQNKRTEEITRLQMNQNVKALMRLNEELSAETRKQFPSVELVLTEQQRKSYTTEGGTPNLDGEYTVFGEVIEGMDVIDVIAGMKTDENFRPLQNIVIRKAVVE